MAATASTRELSRAITAYITSPSLPLPLSDNLTQIIDAYLEKHEKHEKSNVASAERLQEELQSIYQKNVQGHPARIAPFLAIIRSLRQSIRSTHHILHWFNVLVDPVLDHICQEKGLAREAIANVASLLAGDLEQGDGPDPLFSRCIERWLLISQDSEGGGDATTVLKEKIVREAILMMGKKHTKSFMTTLDVFLVKRKSRAQSIALLCELIRSQPPHLHLAVQTPLFKSLLVCLQQDTSTTTISLALTALVMLLPNFPSSVVAFLPTLFNIYARLLFWDRERSAETSGSGSGSGSAPGSSSRLPAEDAGSWEVDAFSSESEGVAIAQLLNFFTILYGLYPINFMDYIRKPQRYLRHANAPNPDDIEVQPSEIRHRSEQFRQMHLLHPNFYSMTIDSEKTDFGRWIKSEPAVVVAECMALCTSSEPYAGEDGAPAPIPRIGLESPSSFPGDDSDNRNAAGGPLLSRSVVLSPPQGPVSSGSWRHMPPSAVDPPSRAPSAIMRQSSQSSQPSTRGSLETAAREMGGDSPTLPPLLVSSSPQAQLLDTAHANKMGKSGLSQSLANDSVPSLSLSHHESIPDRTSGVPGLLSQLPVRAPEPGAESGVEVEIARLRRHVAVLKSDLSFERYMKQQHMAHIGELRRRQVKEAATEAETQSLIMGNKNLKSRLEEAKRSELQVKKDSERSRTLAKKWEAELSGKLKALREEQKKRAAELASLQRELDSAKDECEKLRKLVCDAEVRELNSKQTMQSIDINVAEMERLRAEVERLAESERDYQAKEMEREAMLGATVEAEHRAEVLAMKVKAQESELLATREHYQSQMVVLNTKLAEALRHRQHSWDRRDSRDGRDRGSGSGSGNGDFSSLFESALAASRAKQAELQKQYAHLLKKHHMLQSSLLDMTAGTGAAGRPLRSEVSASADADAEVSAIVGVGPSFSARTRMQRGFSDPEGFELPSQDSFGSSVTSTGTTIHRPSTPSGQVGGAHRQDPSGSNTSPQSERYYGRGGVQNTIRKERKDKKKEESDKKDKKSGGIRGIRGFP